MQAIEIQKTEGQLWDKKKAVEGSSACLFGCFRAEKGHFEEI